jgi:putative redox protein
LMSLGACTAITLKMYADRKKWPVEDIYVEMTHEKAIPSERSDESEASRESGVSGASTQKIDRIEKEILIKGDLDESQLDRMLQISHKCPVNKTLQGTSIEMKASIRKL